MTTKTPDPPKDAVARARAWWHDAVVYQVYLRSFKDGDSDGIGDLAGLAEGLPSIAALGCDAIWLSPCYASPQRDHGYDIADYRRIDPAYGANEDFDRLVARAHRLGLKVLMDMVANHCSIDHAWFQQALRSAPGSPERARFIFRDGQGADGAVPPNNWESVFGGPAWTRITEADGQPGQWYYHAFDAGQPDFNWRNPDVADEFDDVLRFWFDKGVDGFRIDVAHGHFKSTGMDDLVGNGHNYGMWDQPEVHGLYRRWRALGDSYPKPKYFVGEIWLPDTGSLGRYLRSDELNQAFDFGLLIQLWDSSRMRSAIDAGMAASGDALPAWTLANHDVHRATTRYGQEQSLEAPSPTDMIAAARRLGPVDLPLGLRRAKAAAGLVLALPGTVYLYQGEELGLPEVFDLPDQSRQDPIWVRSNGSELGRDGCRVPLPWRDDGPTFGFNEGGAQTWLPQPTWFGQFSRATEERDPESALSVYRFLLAARRALFGDDRDLCWLNAPAQMLAFTRGHGLCVVNFNDEPVPLDDGWPLGDLVTTTSNGERAGVIPANCTSWFRIRHTS